MKYRKKPVLVDAIQLTQERFDDPENEGEVRDFLEGAEILKREGERDLLIATTLGRDVRASIGHFIIKVPSGEFYICTPDVFWETYEKVVPQRVQDVIDRTLKERDLDKELDLDF